MKPSTIVVWGMLLVAAVLNGTGWAQEGALTIGSNTIELQVDGKTRS